MTIEKNLQNARDECWRSLCKEIEKFPEHKDFNKIIEWTNIQSYLSSKFAYYFLTGRLQPAKAEIYKAAFEENYLK